MGRRNFIYKIVYISACVLRREVIQRLLDASDRTKLVIRFNWLIDYPKMQE